jgi:phage tail sheath gpL-like
MAISFNTIPAANRVPFVFVEFDNSNAIQGNQILQFRSLLIGGKTASGTAVANTLVRVTSVAQAKTLFGAGSLLAGQAEAYIARDSYTELWAMPLLDNGAGVAATGTLVCSGTATAAGTVSMMIAGRRVQAAVASGAASTAVATSINAAINAVADLPVSASVAASTVTLTAKNKGVTGNDIDIRLNYYDGETTAPGVSIAITPMASGATNPDITTALAALGDEWFHCISCAYRDAANLAALNTEMDSRWGPLRQIDGHVFMGATGSVATLTTLGNTVNSKYLSFIPTQNSPTPSWEIGAEATAIAAYYGAIDPARPLQTLEFAWTKAPALTARFTQSERNVLLYDGISSWRVNAGGVPVVERFITTYQTNAAGADDPSYLDVETLLTLQYIRWDWRNHVQRKFPRHKLADDGTRFGEGQAVVTPKIMKAEAINKFADWELAGLVEGREQFKRDLIVERNVSDRNRLDMVLPTNVVNQFRVAGVKISFIL